MKTQKELKAKIKLAAERMADKETNVSKTET